MYFLHGCTHWFHTLTYLLTIKKIEVFKMAHRIMSQQNNYLHIPNIWPRLMRWKSIASMPDFKSATFVCHTYSTPTVSGASIRRSERARALSYYSTVLDVLLSSIRSRSPVDSLVGASSLETRFRWYWFLAEILWPGLLRSRKHQSPSGGERRHISPIASIFLKLCSALIHIYLPLFQQQQLLLHRIFILGKLKT